MPGCCCCCCGAPPTAAHPPHARAPLRREQIQAVVDANLIGPLVHLLGTAEFDIKKEAAWAISNATSGGTADQLRLLVQHGCIKPLVGWLAGRVLARIGRVGA